MPDSLTSNCYHDIVGQFMTGSFENMRVFSVLPFDVELDFVLSLRIAHVNPEPGLQIICVWFGDVNIPIIMAIQLGSIGSWIDMSVWVSPDAVCSISEYVQILQI